MIASGIMEMCIRAAHSIVTNKRLFIFSNRLAPLITFIYSVHFDQHLCVSIHPFGRWHRLCVECNPFLHLGRMFFFSIVRPSGPWGEGSDYLTTVIVLDKLINIILFRSEKWTKIYFGAHTNLLIMCLLNIWCFCGTLKTILIMWHGKSGDVNRICTLCNAVALCKGNFACERWKEPPRFPYVRRRNVQMRDSNNYSLNSSIRFVRYTLHCTLCHAIYSWV